MRLIKYFSLILLLVLACSFDYSNSLYLPQNKIYYLNKSFTLDKINKLSKENIQKKVLKKKEKVYKIDFKLSGIIKSGNKFFAIINGNTYEIGDKINGFIIKKIMINKIIVVPVENENKKIAVLLKNY